MTKQYKKTYLGLIIGFLATGAIGIALENQREVSLSILTFPLALSLTVINLFFLLIGSAIGYLGFSAFNKAKINEERKTGWQAQDVKLMASITSDREKQLEAKITTLEAALKNMMKR